MMKNKYRVLITSCWALLAICCMIKLFGANIFIAGVEEGNFKLACEFINNNELLKFIISVIINTVSCSIYYMAVLKDKKPKIKWLMPLIIYNILKQIFKEYNLIFFILDIFMMIGLPIVINKRKLLRPVLGFLITFIFQFLSMFLKLDNFIMFDENFLIDVILSIDYYIMLILYYLYSNYNDELIKEGD